MTEHDLGLVGDFTVDEAKRVVIDGTPIAVVKTEDAIYAVGDRCSHADVSLSEGDVEGHYIECWLHGSQFDLTNGQPTCLPANEPIPTYPIRIDGAGEDARVILDLN